MKKAMFLAVLVAVAGFFFRPSQSTAVKPSDFGLKEGDLISAIFSDDPDVYIINENGYKRLFLNPEIFKFYAHLGGFANVKLVTPEIRDSFPTSGFFRNCEDNDQKVFGTSVEGEDTGRLHWIDKTGVQAVQEDPEFFKKVFCINRKEFNWYPKGGEYKVLKEVPTYSRKEEATPYVICHHPTDDPKSWQTIRVAAEALNAHFQHGDTKGACPTTAIAPTQVAATPTSTQPAELCYNCPTTSPVSPTNECRTFSYSGEEYYKEEDGYLHLLKDKGVKVTGTPYGFAWSTWLSGTLGNAGEVVGFASPDRSEPDTGISDNETLIIELTHEFAQAVEIGLAVAPSTTSNNVPATVSITALNQMGRTLDGLKQTFTGVTDNKLTPAAFTLKAPTSEISRIIIQAHQYPSGGVWFRSIGATNACTTVSTAPSPTPTSTFVPTPTPPATYIKVISPNGEEIWQKGATQVIKWDSSNVSKVYIKLRKGNDTYPGPEGKVSDIISNNGYFKWTPPTTLPNGDDYYIRVIDGNYTGVLDDSDRPFSLVPTIFFSPSPTATPTYTVTPTPTPTTSPISGGQKIRVTSPNGGEQWSIGNKYTITWENPGFINSIYVDLYKAGKYLSGLGGLGYTYGAPTSWVWDTTNTPNFSAGSDFKMHVRSDTDSSIYDESDNYFTVSGPSYPVTCDSLKTNSATSRYFSICSGYDNVCFNKYYGTYQGCTNNTRDDCTTYNTNASQNMLCTVSGAPVSSPTPTPTPTTTFSPTPSVTASFSFSPTPTPTPSPTPTSTASVSFDNFSRNLAGTSKITISRDLYRGTSGEDVRQLQALLVGVVNYPADLLTGYFGPITQNAVKKLQEKLGIRPAFGYFGAITRRVLNALISQ